MFSLAFAAALAGHIVAGPEPKTGEDVVRQMYQRYAGEWYTTLTFIQRTTFPNGKVQTWYEASDGPGRLRIDFAPLDSLNGLIFRSDSVYAFRRGQLVDARPYVHPLMVLGPDVHLIPPERSIEKIRALGFDLSRLSRNEYEGRPVYVVGATAGDTTSAQFWVDQERLILVRILEPSKEKPGTFEETRYTSFRPAAGGWIETDARFFHEGKEIQREEYTTVTPNAPVDSAWFDPKVRPKMTWAYEAEAGGRSD